MGPNQIRMGRPQCAERAEFLYDPEDQALYEAYRWRDRQGYIATTHRRKVLRFHRLVMNAPDDVIVDHVNHDRYDNRKANLRLITLSGNALNRKGPRKGSLTQFLGVTKAKDAKRACPFKARLGCGNKKITIGYFATAEEAAAAVAKVRAEAIDREVAFSVR